MDFKSSRLQKKQEEKLKSIPTGRVHRGYDATGDIQLSSLSKTSEKGFGTDIFSKVSAKGISGDSEFVKDLFGHNVTETNSVHYEDNRMTPWKGGNYAGHQLTVTPISPMDFDGGLKKTPEPKSPRPADLGVRGPQRAHVSAFNLSGEEGEGAGTVWAPEVANLSVDKGMENYGKARAVENKPSWMVRLDTHDRSSLSVVTKPDKDSDYNVFSVQYQRKF